MGYERDPRGSNPQDDSYGRSDSRDYGSGRDYSYSSAREYQAAGQIGDRDRQRDNGREGYGSRDYGSRDYGNQRYGQREQFNRGRDDYGSARFAGQEQQYGRDHGRSDNRYVERSRYGADASSNGSPEYHGSYGSDGRRFEDVGRFRHADDDNHRGRQQQGRDYGRQPQGYDYDERGFFARAGDEVRSWFGDDEAERRRDMDSRYDERGDDGRSAGERGQNRHGRHHDADYHSWRSTQIAALDRDYDEYRQHNRSKFDNEFSTWRTSRQSQRDALNKVDEHMDVVGADGEHVGTVDKVRGDRILLTKNDADAGGRHHSIPSSWIATVDTKVTLSRSADDAKKAWKDEERNQAMFGYDDNAGDQQGRNGQQDRASSTYGASASSTGASASGNSDASASSVGDASNGARGLNKSFSGTY